MPSQVGLARKAPGEQRRRGRGCGETGLRDACQGSWWMAHSQGVLGTTELWVSQSQNPRGTDNPDPTDTKLSTEKSTTENERQGHPAQVAAGDRDKLSGAGAAVVHGHAQACDALVTARAHTARRRPVSTRGGARQSWGRGPTDPTAPVLPRLSSSPWATTQPERPWTRGPSPPGGRTKPGHRAGGGRALQPLASSVGAQTPLPVPQAVTFGRAGPCPRLLLSPVTPCRAGGGTERSPGPCQLPPAKWQHRPPRVSLHSPRQPVALGLRNASAHWVLPGTLPGAGLTAQPPHPGLFTSPGARARARGPGLSLPRSS